MMELRRLCLEVAEIFPQAVFFAGQLVFSEEVDGFFSRFLHNHTALDLLRWLQLHGLSLVILPVRVASANSLKLLPLSSDSRVQPIGQVGSY